MENLIRMRTVCHPSPLPNLVNPDQNNAEISEINQQDK